MAVNQAQVDHIISTASADDPEVKLLKMADEVELLKTSIKRLLIDIRERMNDLENPFNIAVWKTNQDKESLASQVLGEELGDDDETEEEGGLVEADEETTTKAPGSASTKEDDSDLVSLLKAQLASMPQPRQQGEDYPSEGYTQSYQPQSRRMKLQNVYGIFEWAGKNISRYGHERFELMVESYQTMGYLNEETILMIRDIAKLIPPAIHATLEISAEEFVGELYNLNGIINPKDGTLDRDMVEILMDIRSPEREKERNVTLEYGNVMEHRANVN